MKRLITILLLLFFATTSQAVLVKQLPVSNPAATMKYKSGRNYFETTPTLVLWAFGDTQPTDPCDWAILDAVIADMGSIPFECAIVVGDIVDDGETAADFDTFLTAILAGNNRREDFFCIAGNHDWQNDGTLDNYKEAINNRPNYTVLMGNIFIIFMSDEQDSVIGEISNETFRWWEQQVMENQDKNIITVTHAPLYTTTTGSGTANWYIENSARFSTVLESYDMDMWIHGHAYGSLEAADFIKQITHGSKTVWHMNVGLHIPQLGGADQCSRILFFTDASTTCTVKLRNHIDEVYNDTYETAITLKYAAEVASHVRFDGRFATSPLDREIDIKGEISGRQFTDDSLLGWWQFNGNFKDSSQNGNDGTEYNNATAANNVLELDGTGDFVSMARITDVESFTVSFWAYPTRSAYDGMVSQDSGGGAHREWYIATNTGEELKTAVYNTDGTDYTQITNNDCMSINEWHYVVMTVNDFTKKVYGYVDLVEVIDDDFTKSVRHDTDVLFRIGLMYDDTFCFAGRIADLRIFERVLSLYEMEQIYAEGNKRYGHFGTLNVTSSLSYLAKVETVTSQTNVLTAAESGTVYQIVYTGTHTTTLPDAAAGLIYTFIDASATAADDVVIDCQAGDNIDGDTNGDAIESVTDAVGQTVALIAIDGTDWHTINVSGTWGQQ